MKIFLRKLANLRGWAYFLFWSWNIIFLAFMFLGFGPRMLPEMLTAVRAGDIPPAFLGYALLMTLIPAIAVSLGLTLLRRSPERLFALGYGIEGPLMLLLGLRFFVIRQMTPAVAFLLAVAGLGMAAFLWQILDRKIDQRGPLLTHLRALGLTLLLVSGLYAGAWLAFYALPMGAQGVNLILEILKNLPEFLRNFWAGLLDILTEGILWLPFFGLGSILLIYTATLFVLLPIAVPVLCIRAWQQGMRALMVAHGPVRAAGLAAGVLLICATLFVQTNRQPQHQAFALLEKSPASIDQAQALLAQEEVIRKGLLNAYLAPQRYISAIGEVRHISEIYKYVLNMPAERAERVQKLYETVAQPLLYQPVKQYEPTENRWENRPLAKEPQQAAQLYANFFDQPIIEGEREAVVQAVRTTWSIDQARAGWQAVDDREIYLARQEVNVAEHGDWAEVELYEVYQNQTGQRQEVVYYFSLPESAVITGVWLGDSANRNQRFEYRVAPRGAAQAVYRNEVRRNMDPALVEQIGPRQYRLRIFPIEPQQRRWDEESHRSTLEAAPPMHMWLTWRALVQDNRWPLPRLAEKRNVYWDDESTRLVNGQPMAADEKSWLPESVAAGAAAQPLAHRVDFPGGESILIRPVSDETRPQLPNGLQLAVVLDRSRSMVSQQAEVEAAFNRLNQLAETGAKVDIYLTASQYRGEEPLRVSLADLNANNIIYYGGQNAAELLLQFDQLHAGQTYDAILVLTDGSGYELATKDIDVPTPNAPVWMVHLGRDFPLGYDDATLEAIQASGGGAAGSLDEALSRLAAALAGNELADIIDGYEWLTVPGEVADEMVGAKVIVHRPTDAFAAFAARRLILAEMRQYGEPLGRLDRLDYLHAIAVEHSVVTPYSSMIVLVNEEQRQLLKRLEQQGDRFEREHEEVGETTPQLAVTGVPEPEEWLLLALAAGVLGWYLYNRRRGVAVDYMR